ncbi:integrase core domain-containing protein [Hoeflea phototrophica]|uniref:integrase core domain-containing protein n=1 Tax=Hoeflea phototrophica TaxID=244596 RepID=UPI000A0179FE
MILQTIFIGQPFYLTLDDTRLKMREWRRDYNEVRRHSAIGNNPPISRLNCSEGALAP